MGVGYDDSDHGVHREKFVEAAGGGATTSYAKFKSFYNVKLLRVKAWVTTAGTAAGHLFDVYVGTSSVGSLAFGTSTAGVALSVTLNTEVPAETAVTVKSGPDIVGKADILYEYMRDD